jgi:putative transposase
MGTPCSEEKRQKIILKRRETATRRQSQSLKVYELKVDVHHVSREQIQRLYRLFIEAKWVVNDLIASDDIFNYKYQDHRTVVGFDRDKNPVERKITLRTEVHQNLIDTKKTDIVTLSKSKKKGNKTGKLKFKRQVNYIPLRTGTIRIKSSKRVSIPEFTNLPVYGLEQFIYRDGYEVANANLIKKASGIYLKVSVCLPRQGREKTNRTVGLDFGIKTAITTSDGEKFDCNVQESDYLKFLSRKLNKKIVKAKRDRRDYRSKRYCKLLNQLQKEYEHLSNKKADNANKLVAYLFKEYDIVYFQDEQLAGWKRKKRSKKTGRRCGFSFGKQVLSSMLGRVKARLVRQESSGRSYMIGRFEPTTKYCPSCGNKRDIGLDERTYACECGYAEDRDVHAAKNVKLLGSIQRAKQECLEQASAEKLASTASNLAEEALDATSSFVEAKTEAPAL